MNVSDLLASAATLVRTHGLWKAGEKPTGGFCLLSAVYQVRVESGVDEELERQAIAVVVTYLGLTGAYGVIRWNDHPDRDAEEVATVLDVAALIAGAKAQPVRVFEVTR